MVVRRLVVGRLYVVQLTSYFSFLLENLVHLRRLKLNNNCFRALPESLEHLTQLESLDISKNPIFAPLGEGVPIGIAFLTRLEELKMV